jgi:uncharacterized membrane protein
MTAREAPLLFNAVLRPHRSASLKAIHIVIGFLLCVFIPTGVIFTLAGAWPVFGFMGLEVAALFLALRWHHRAGGRTMETISITPAAITVSRTDHWGRRTEWSVPPQWLRIESEETPGRADRLVLRSHGRTIAVGAFLSPDERAGLARALQGAIDQLKFS